MTLRLLLPVVVALIAFSFPKYALAEMAIADSNVVIVDHEEGYLHFLIFNNTHKIIYALYGRVYGYGNSKHPGAWLLNNPHAMGTKVSLGPHLPGRVALYRFITPPAQTWYPHFLLTINDKSVRVGG